MNERDLKAAAKKVLEAAPANPNEAMHVLGVVIVHMLLTLSPDPQKDALQFASLVMKDVKDSLLAQAVEESKDEPIIVS